MGSKESKDTVRISSDKNEMRLVEATNPQKPGIVSNMNIGKIPAQKGTHQAKTSPNEHLYGDEVKFYHGKLGIYRDGDIRLSTKQESPNLAKAETEEVLRITKYSDFGLPDEKREKLESLLIFENDRRRCLELDKLKTYPYTTIIQLKTRFGRKVDFGSAVVVGPRHALTVAHNVYVEDLEGESGFVDYVRATPSRTEGALAFKEAHAYKVYKFDDCDLALLILDKPIGYLTGWCKMTCHQNMTDLVTKTVEVTGYPWQYGDTIFTHAGVLIEFNKNKLYYDADTSKGQSGSPVWIEDQNGISIIGIHRRNAGSRKNLNRGVWLSEDRLKIIIRQIEETFTTSFDREHGKMF